MIWEEIDTGVHSASWNMAFDADLLDSLEGKEGGIIHFYEWEKKSATYGHFVKPEEHLNLDAIAGHDIELAKRPTGGGIVFHIWDLAFSVLLSKNAPLFSENTLDNYALVNQAVLSAASAFLEGREGLDLTPDDMAYNDAAQVRFCMARPTKYDVVMGHRKIAGAAQRRKKGGFLHQGTISLALPDEKLLSDVLKSEAVLQAMNHFSFPLLGKNSTPHSLELGKNQLKTILSKHLRALHHVNEKRENRNSTHPISRFS